MVVRCAVSRVASTTRAVNTFRPAQVEAISITRGVAVVLASYPFGDLENFSRRLLRASLGG